MNKFLYKLKYKAAGSATSKKILQINRTQKKVIYNNRNNTIEFREFGFIIKDNYHHLLEGYWFLQNIFHNYSYIKFYVENDVFFIVDEKVRIRILTKEELYIYHEVFINKSYDLNLVYDSYSVIDIGMNVGMASIFFASKDEVNHVYGFEPVLQTFEDAFYNFNLNKECENKVRPANYGIGARNETVDIQFDEQNKGRTSVIKNTGFNPKKFRTESIKLWSINEVFESIFANDKEPFLVKMDCEGSEYDIFASLPQIPVQVKAMIIEYHNGYKVIKEQLTNNKFNTFVISDNDKVGLIYAIR
ncbi:FkbM family methyltransferase [Flammeovirgaceae bacterium 311]|nr:FkbM family methyltransferase [Flammeovirgaceae bacterium 311]